MKKIIYILASITAIIFFNSKLNAQGCVAIRSNGDVCTMDHDPSSHNSGSSKWLLNLNNRYFKSYKHFVGTAEQKQRVALGTEVINHAYTMDVSLSHIINSRFSVTGSIQIVSNTRSSLYEHKNSGRYTTKTFGVGDARLSVYAWLTNPVKMHRLNVQAGLGLKLPTGDYKYQDWFHLTDSTKIMGPVDQSIQLGDGGTGFTTELNAFYNVSRRVSMYGNLYYLVNPREQNGVSTARGATASASAIKNGSDVMSVPDQYMIRAGFNFTFHNLQLTAGVRDECLPVHDLVGGSNGFRRPGYIISAEPGVSYRIKKVTVYGFVPFALKRSRTQSVPDKISTKLSGNYTQGDAAFADYLVNFGISFKF
ncbi:MAG: hypothetical protein JWN76_774 [Chitinophagaceae bacterium]|nr:hypothetical protein [Chitinophagaceae bacterium]